MAPIISFLLWICSFGLVTLQESYSQEKRQSKSVTLSSGAPAKSPLADKEIEHAFTHLTDTLEVQAKITNSLPPKIKFNHIGAQQGLSQGHGNCIFQDSEGFMWFGTMDGLNKYDGYKITVYRNNPVDSTLLSNNYITSIYEDSQQNLWIGTQTGLDRLNKKTGKFIHYKTQPGNPRSISHNSIYTIYEDKKGNLWIGTAGGLNLYHPKEDNFTRFTHSPDNPGSISDNYVNAVLEDRNGNLWIGTHMGGVNLFDRKSKSFVSYKHEPHNPSSLSHNRVTAILEDRKGNLWVSTWGGGLNLFNPQTKTFSHYRYNRKIPKSIGSDVIFALLEDKKGRLWIGTENGGLNLYNPSTDDFTRYTHQINNASSLSNNTVSALYEDNCGNIWVGTHRGGIDYFYLDGEKFRHYYQTTAPFSLSNNNIKSFWEADNGKILIGTDGGGLNIFDREKDTFTHFKNDINNPHSISSDVVLTIVEDKKGKVWLGTWEGGLNVFDPDNNTFTSYFHNPADSSSISSNKPWILFEDRKENLWIGTMDAGLNLLNKETNRFIRFQHNPNNTNSLSNNVVKAICEDSLGKLWIGTAEGLDLFDPSSFSFVHFKSDANQNNSLSHNSVNALLINRTGNLWIGTQKGLNLYNRKTNSFTVFTEKDGLCNNTVQGIIEDDSGNIWISTLNGISKFNPIEKIFQNFSLTDGLQGNEFSLKALLKAKSGELFFGGINGFNVFHPDSIKHNSFIPPVHLTDFQLFNKSVGIEDNNSPLQQPISQSKDITLSYDQSVISFEFVALNYRSPEENQYAYKLEGFDKEWNYVGNQRKATFTNLDPGKYIFKVKASNNDGIWNERGTSVNLIVTPPFWRTWWFRGSSLLLVLAFIWAAHQTKTNQIKARNRTLEAKVWERTQQIEQQKQEIALHLEKLQLFNQEISYQNEVLEQKVKERTQELQASNEELILLTNALPALITYIDKQQRYQFNNKAYEDWFGILSSQVYGRHVSEVIGEKSYEKVRPLVEKALAGGVMHMKTWLSYPKIGERFVSIDYIPHVKSGQVLGIYALVFDITEQEMVKQALEEALKETKQANEELRKTNVDLDNFVYTASHDLKSPIANLEGITHLLSRKLKGKLDEKERELLVMINNMTTRLKSTIADLTEISKVQKDLDQAKEPVSFSQIMGDIQADLQSLIAESGTVITSDWGENEIQYARKNLRSILYNLVANALKYRSPDRVPHIRINTYIRGEDIVLTVEDNGLGMTPHQLSKLFGMFKRFHSHVEGSGIGLYITKRIIENNGGRIQVESELDKGTKFTVYFKAAQSLVNKV